MSSCNRYFKNGIISVNTIRKLTVKHLLNNDFLLLKISKFTDWSKKREVWIHKATTRK